MNTSVSNKRISITGRMERIPNSNFQKMLVGVLIVAWFVESLDLGGMIYLMPVLGSAFKLDPKIMGYLGSISFAGMFFGSLISGFLSDKIGRKKTIIYSMLFWGISGFLVSNAWSTQSLLVFRFLLGVGLGAQVPVGVTMLSELVPSKNRGMYLALYQAFYPLGIAGAGLLTYLLLPRFNWQGVFLAEALPALWLFVVWKFIPESPYWLESKSRYSEADKVMDIIEKNVQKSTGKPLPSVYDEYLDVIVKKPSNQGFSELLTKPFIPIMLMALIWQSTALLGFYGLSTWLSVLLVAKGFAIIKSTAFIAVIALGGLPAFFLVYFLVEKIGRKKTTLVFAVTTAVSSFIYGSAPTITLVIILGLAFMFFQYGYSMSCNVYLPEIFPTHLRGRGVGFGLACGRVGAFMGPISLGYVISGYGPLAVFMVASSCVLIGALAVLILGPETRGKVF